MKQILLMIAAVALVGCGKQEQTDANEPTPATTEKPVKELTKEDVVGTYERKWEVNPGDGVVSIKAVLHRNGTVNVYEDDKMLVSEGKADFKVAWKIIDGELHVEGEGSADVFRINKDRSITEIATIRNGKREEHPKDDEQYTFKKYTFKKKIEVSPTNHSSYTNKLKHNIQTTSALKVGLT